VNLWTWILMSGVTVIWLAVACAMAYLTTSKLSSRP
jgi:hypothetical protein